MEGMEADVPQILSNYLDSKGISQIDVAKKLNLSKQTVNSLLNGRRNFGKKSAMEWQKHFGLSANWLITGSGPMFADGSNLLPNNNERVNNSNNLAPNVYDNEVFLCGFPVGESGAITNTNMEKTLVVPGAPKDVIYVRAHGNSMVSTDPTQSIPDGAYVAIRKMRTGIVQWGEVYAIATSDGMILKRLMPCEADDTRIRCVSNNGASYPPFDIQKSDIIDIAIVVGVLTVAWRTA